MSPLGAGGSWGHQGWGAPGAPVPVSDDDVGLPAPGVETVVSEHLSLQLFDL